MDNAPWLGNPWIQMAGFSEIPWWLKLPGKPIIHLSFFTHHPSFFQSSINCITMFIGAYHPSNQTRLCQIEGWKTTCLQKCIWSFLRFKRGRLDGTTRSGRLYSPKDAQQTTKKTPYMYIIVYIYIHMLRWSGNWLPPGPFGIATANCQVKKIPVAPWRFIASK